MRPLFSLTSLALPQQQSLSGATAALGVALVALGFGIAAGFEAGAAAAVGAICVSIVDTPSPPAHKRRGFLLALVLGSAITLASGLAAPHPWIMAPLLVLIGFAAAMMTAHGKAALALCMAMILAAIFMLGAELHDRAAILHHSLLYAIGGACYLVYGTAMASLLERRHKRIALVGALRGLADYTREKAALYDPAEPLDRAYDRLIERQVTLMERVDAARNLLLRHIEAADEHRLAAGLVALLDAFETVLSSQIDYALLRKQYGDRGTPLPALRDIVLRLADRVDMLAEEIAGHAPCPALDPLESDLAKLKAKSAELLAAEDPAALELRAAFTRINNAVQAVTRQQAVARDDAAADAMLKSVTPEDFLPPRPYGWRIIAKHFRRSSPVFRYALRFSLAILCGYLISLMIRPWFPHGSWIMLTVAVIMRASYSATRQRQKDRLIGNLFGCVLAALALHFLSDPWLLALAALSIGLSHAYAPVRYRVTAVSAAVMALLMMHFINPSNESLLLERLVDTLIGALIAWGFSYLWPNWERQGLPDRGTNLLRNLRKYARQALKLNPPDQTYRLARKDLFDAIADFAGALKRMPDEPGAWSVNLPRKRLFLSLSYRLMSHLAALHIVLRMRGREIEPHLLHRLLASHSSRLLDILGAPPSVAPQTPPQPLQPAELGQAPLLLVLTRRLHQAEAMAREIRQLEAPEPVS
jgi:uncharacterized membrane protein YccC